MKAILLAALLAATPSALALCAPFSCLGETIDYALDLGNAGIDGAIAASAIAVDGTVEVVDAGADAVACAAWFDAPCALRATNRAALAGVETADEEALLTLALADAIALRTMQYGHAVLA